MPRTAAAASTVALEATGAVLLATAVSDALGHATASFHLLVLAVPVAAVAGLLSLATAVDAANSGRTAVLGRFQTILSALLLGAVILGAATRAPATAETDVPGVASATLAVAFAVLALQALFALVPARR